MTPVGVPYTDHLVTLVAEAQAAADRLAAAGPDRRAGVATQSRRRYARLSARLDASPLTDETADAVDAGELEATAGAATAGDAASGWARALKLDGMPTQRVAAIEYANLQGCFDAERGIVPRIFSDPGGALAELHGLICEGLIEPALVGALRKTPRAVHDGAQGMMIYASPEPEALQGLFAALTGWLGSASASKPDLVVAGIVHERILEWQPFEAANGRVARAAARVVLRARGLDPDGLAVTEQLLSADPAGYHTEVAATKRRRGELGRWLERYAEAVVDGLERAVDEVDARPPPDPPERAVAHIRALGAGQLVTLPEYAAAVGVNREVARRELGLLRRASYLAREPGRRGLRYRVS